MMTENQAIVLECLFTDKFSFSHKHTCGGSKIFGGVKLGVGGLISAYKLPHNTHSKVVKS
jgi:putative IMPACT (imprinted ancient) family translation regulator